jgi:hypothetical protein
LLCIFSGLVAAMLASSPRASAEPEWMDPEAFRAEFVGKQLHGYYFDRVTWTATFHDGGRYEAQGEELPLMSGTWHLRGRVFCHSAGPLYTGCGVAKKISANCYQFHQVDAGANGTFEEGNVRPHARWHSRGWRQDEPSTCEATRPTA